MFLKCEHVSLWITKSIALDISNILLLFSLTMKPQKQHNHCGEETCVIVNVNQCQSQQNNLGTSAKKKTGKCGNFSPILPFIFGRSPMLKTVKKWMWDSGGPQTKKVYACTCMQVYVCMYMYAYICMQFYV